MKNLLKTVVLVFPVLFSVPSLAVDINDKNYLDGACYGELAGSVYKYGDEATIPSMNLAAKNVWSKARAYADRSKRLNAVVEDCNRQYKPNDVAVENCVNSNLSQKDRLWWVGRRDGTVAILQKTEHPTQAITETSFVCCKAVNCSGEYPLGKK